MAVQAIIFDCFGVLVTDGKSSITHDFPHLKTQIHDLALRSDYGYISRQDFNAELSQMTGIPTSDIEGRYWLKNVRNERMFEWVRSLKTEGVYKIGLLSNIGREWLDDFIPPAERTQLFDAEVLSGVEGMVKPDERIFCLAADRLGVVPEDCVMIDDLLTNIDGASRAAMQTILFTSMDQAQADLQGIIASNA